MKFQHILGLLAVLSFASGEIMRVHVGGIFDAANKDSEIAFYETIDYINRTNRNIALVAEVVIIEATNSIMAERAVCELLSKGVVAIFGPFTENTIGIVASVCSKFHIPHFITTWVPESYRTTFEESNHMTYNLYPDSNLLARAFSDVIADNDWKNYQVFYDSQEGLMRVKDILQLHGPNDRPIVVRKLADDAEYRPLLKEVKSGGGNWDIILDCADDKILKIIKNAKELDMIGDYQRFFITSLDTHTLSFEETEAGNGNITTMRLFDRTNEEIEEFMSGVKQPFVADTLTMLMHDAIYLLYNAIEYSLADDPIIAANLDCASFLDAEDEIGSEEEEEEVPTWEGGLKVFDNIKKMMKKDGFTGKIMFKDRKRVDFTLDVMELTKSEVFRQIAKWENPGNLQYMRSIEAMKEEERNQIANKHHHVVSKLGDPWLKLREPQEDFRNKGNERYEGFVMDLMSELARTMNFTYQIDLIADGKYGIFDKKTGKWNGVVRHIMDRKAAMGVGDITITYERRRAVDFTMPFMTLGISILYAKPHKEAKSLWTFMNPFSSNVWMCIMGAIFFLVIAIFFTSRMSPAEWENPHPCNKDSVERENIFIWKNCMWLVIGSIMGQGSDILPKGASTRLVCGMWWFFALIMLASYTANLAAFLTMERMDQTIENIHQLAEQNEIKYGAVLEGATRAFFQHSNNSLYQKMYNVMIGSVSKGTVFTNSNPQGVDRVLKGKKKYAFFMEDTMIDYYVERNCNLTKIGDPLDSKGYGIALPLDSPYRKALNEQILLMQERGKLKTLKETWWKVKDNPCESSSKGGELEMELGVDEVGGVFLVLLGGTLAGLAIGVLEFLWHVKDVAVTEKLTPVQALKQELAFAIRINIQTKPVARMISEESLCSQPSYESSTQAATNGEKNNANDSKSTNK